MTAGTQSSTGLTETGKSAPNMAHLHGSWLEASTQCPLPEASAPCNMGLPHRATQYPHKITVDFTGNDLRES